MLDVMTWTLIVGFITLIAGLSLSAVSSHQRRLQDLDKILFDDDDDDGDGDGDKHLRGMQTVFATMYGGGDGEMRLKIPADCPKTDHDFIVDLECPDGTTARVLIPVRSDSYEGKCSRVLVPCDPPIGLNLVCSGHYT